jgi:hypothetical protein
MGWPMKTERDLIALARGRLSVEQIAAKLKIEPPAVIKISRRLGIYFEPPRKVDRRRKAKRA